MVWQWNYDEGNQGGFGGADYARALREGGPSKSELRATREALAGWSRTDPRGRNAEITPGSGIATPGDTNNWNQRSAFWGRESGDAGSSGVYDTIMGTNRGVGWTGYGNISQERTGDNAWGDNEGRGWYTEDDLYGGLAEGQSYEDIEQHFQDTGNLATLRPGSDLLQRISSGASDERAEGYRERISGLEGNVSSLTSQRADAVSSLNTLQGKYDNELQALKRAQLAVKHSSPTAVQGPTSATGIRFAKSPTLQGKGGFRGTLAGLTSSHGPAQKLKSNQVTV